MGVAAVPGRRGRFGGPGSAARLGGSGLADRLGGEAIGSCHERAKPR